MYIRTGKAGSIKGVSWNLIAGDDERYARSAPLVAAAQPWARDSAFRDPFQTVISVNTLAAPFGRHQVNRPRDVARGMMELTGGLMQPRPGVISSSRRCGRNQGESRRPAYLISFAVMQQIIAD